MKEFIEIAKTITVKEWSEACGMVAVTGGLFFLLTLIF